MMKTVRLFSLLGGAAFAMFALNACTDNIQEVMPENNPVVKPGTDINEVMFVASNFVPDGEVASRTTITPHDNGATFAWAEGDEIGVVPDKGSQVYFTITDIEETEPNKAVFTGDAWGLKAGHTYSAYYPLYEDMKLDRTQVPVNYTYQEYTFREDGTINSQHDYMAACPVTRADGGLNFEFKHLGALVEVKFTVPFEETADDEASITINNLKLVGPGVIPTIGTFDLSKDKETGIAIRPTANASVVTVSTYELTATKENPKVSVFFMMPPMAVNPNTLSVVVEYSDTDGESVTLPYKITTSKEALVAGKYYTLETLPIEEMPDAFLADDCNAFSTFISDAVSNSGATKLKFVTGSTVEYTDGYECYVDALGTIAYTVYDEENGCLEVHTPASSFVLSGSCSSMFTGSSLAEIDLTGLNTAAVTDMSYMFQNCQALKKITFGDSFTTASVTDMNSMFYYCSELESITFDESFTTASVTNMSYMFSGCSSLTLLDLSSFNTSSVTDMSYMFDFCSELESITFGQNFSTASVTNMSYMFQSCSSFTSLDLSKFDTSKVTNMHCMFQSCSSFTSLDLSKFDTSSVTDMSRMFYDCIALESITFGEKFSTASVTDMNNMFYGCSSLTSLNLSSFTTASVTDMNSMFFGCSELESITFDESFTTASVTNMSYMFLGCSSLTLLDLSSFNTSSVTDMSYMFDVCSELESITFGQNFSTAAVTNMSYMFQGCSSLTSLDLSKFDTSKVTNMYYMFQSCWLLTSLDLSKFDTSSVTDMSYMFYDCNALESIKFGEKFTTASVTDMNSMFSGCYELDNLDLTSFTFVTEGCDYANMFNNLGWNSYASNDNTPVAKIYVTKEGYDVLIEKTGDTNMYYATLYYLPTIGSVELEDWE